MSYWSGDLSHVAGRTFKGHEAKGYPTVRIDLVNVVGRYGAVCIDSSKLHPPGMGAMIRGV